MMHQILAGILLGVSLASVAAERPNILYLYVDDMGWGSISSNAQAERRAAGLPMVLTPNLDRLAAEGVNFRRGYGCHVCSPARSSQQSGFHQGHTYADRNDPDNGKKAMRSDEVLMGDALLAAGYRTGYWGKWGYGGSAEMNDPVIENVQTLPTSHGYTHVLAELHHVRAHTFFQPTLWSAPVAQDTEGGLELVPNAMAQYLGKEAYPQEPAFQDHPDYPTPGYCDDAYAFAALDFVRAGAKQYAEDGTPFFGLFAAQIPHGPFDEVAKLPEWDVAYRDDPEFASYPKQSQQWAAMVTRIDAHFGNLMDALDDPNGDGDTSDSVAANTLVIFQSDNGGPGGSNNKTFDANGGLRGTKGSIWEGGIRVPLVMRWPAQIHEESVLKAGTSSDRVVDVTDLLPTFCDLAGVSTPLGTDGVSIAPTLLSKPGQRHREFLVHEASKGQSSIIRGHQKLVLTVGKKGKRDFALYDLEEDHSEERDIASRHPEIVEELAGFLLGERVEEPAGFATTYHRWTGDAGSFSDEENWSDYRYSNHGEVHLSDDGAPHESWLAQILGTAEAIADKSASVLALEVGGDDASGKLEVLEEVVITGRNEIRIRPRGEVSLMGGTLRSLRWVEVQSGGVLSGQGRIDADLYSAGELEPENGGFVVNGDAHLGGKLVLPEGAKPGVILTAKGVIGKFTNPKGVVVSKDGTKFKIRYRDDLVELVSPKA